MKNIVTVSVLALFFVLGSFTGTPRKAFRLRTVVIDAGHGGKDPGCNGRRSQEADVALKVALELGLQIEKNQPDVKESTPGKPIISWN